MATLRGEFSSRFGFIMAAAGSAVGLGNIWGFPTQAASNGGAAFLLIYLVLAFLLAYPALMAELIIGRHAHANAVTALGGLARGPTLRQAGIAVGLAGILTVSLILSFYAIVAGWMIAFGLAALAELAGALSVAQWLTDFGTARNILFMLLFLVMTAGIVASGVHDGIERWSSRLMPVLIITLFLLVGYVFTLDGAYEGLTVYLLPDFNAALRPELIVSALGASFFSLSLGAGTMLIYGSYIPDSGRLPALGGWVTAVDILIAVTAGFVVLPAMYVALHNGVQIFASDGSLISGDTLIFTVLPALFDTMGGAGVVVSLVFFALMTIAALTSSISMLEVPVSYAIENHGFARHPAVALATAVIAAISLVIVINFQALFGLVVATTTRYAQPLLGLLYCLFCGWVWHRNGILQELKKGQPDIEQGVFWAVWPWYIRFVVPAIILLIFVNSLRG
ncbi:MAG: sodium-dependent transporter [Halieaceae bacterium]|jgi:NSS family neurotransmitter:Na+ symporter|nr:sodium-dependent transporter [Halieaceae bacterium]